MIAAIEHAAFGVAGDQDVLDLDYGHTLLAIDDPEQALDFAASAQTEVHERTASLALALIGGAGADPELNRYWSGLTAGVTRQVRRVLGTFRDKGWLRVDVPFDELVETAAVLGSVETYLRMTHRDGWSADAYRRWCRRMLSETVFAR